MGRKKRRISATGDAEPEIPQSAPPSDPRFKAPPPPPPPPVVAKIESDDVAKDSEKEGAKASNYAITSHSGEIVEEDIYVSSGSEDEDDVVEVVLSGSKMGLMRRGLHQPLLVQNLRQWVRPETTDSPDEPDEEQKQKQEEELEALDPAERAARLLAEKQRKLEEAKESARRIESEENAGRDPCLFSKRTAFDIRFDQIDDKPWERGNGDLTDFFNYGLTVEDWLEYAQQQLTIRQELTDASRQKRPPDPNVVPVTARKPKSQTPKVAVAASKEKKEDGNKASDEENANAPVIGPAMVKKEDGSDGNGTKDRSSENAYKDVFVGDGGAWGAGSAPDSMLARLIAEQTQKEKGGAIKTEPRSTPQSHQNQNDYYSDKKQHHRDDNSYRDDMSMQHSAAGDTYDDRGNSGGGYDDQSQQSSTYGGGDWRQHRPPPPPPPPPISYHGQDDGGGGRFGGGTYHGHDDGGGGRFGGRGRGRGRGRGGGRFNNYGRGGRGGPRPPFPPQGQRWGGRGGRGDFRRPPRDDYRRGGTYGGGGY